MPVSLPAAAVLIPLRVLAGTLVDGAPFWTAPHKLPQVFIPVVVARIHGDRLGHLHDATHSAFSALDSPLPLLRKEVCDRVVGMFLAIPNYDDAGSGCETANSKGFANEGEIKRTER